MLRLIIVETIFRHFVTPPSYDENIKTIMWEDEKDIPLRLKNRIEATIK